jgi:hypothetical protein
VTDRNSVITLSGHLDSTACQMPRYLADNSIFLRVKSERRPSHFSSGSFEGGKNVRKKKEGEFDFVNLRSRVLVSTSQLSEVKQKQGYYLPVTCSLLFLLKPSSDAARELKISVTR